MTENSETRRCPECGATLPADAPPEQPCPACLMKLGLESWTERSGQPRPEDSPTTPWRSRFVPPSPEELAERFPQLEILELIGTGGMGAVYKARQPRLERLVALKLLPPKLGGDPAFQERFSREARSLARLSHPNIVAVYDFGEVRRNPLERASDVEGAANPSESPAGAETEPSVYHYFLMEYVDGVNLRELIRQKKLKPQQALVLVPQICDALQFAHDEGIVHRDIKPENILVDTKGRVKIADFGLAKIIGKPVGDVSLTDTQQVVGTAHYMAPEQTRGARAVDHRADIYSLGVVFYEMLTGELPIGRFESPSRKVQVDVRLDEIVLHTLEQEPERRYQKASDVKTDVETIAAPARGDAGRNRPESVPFFGRPKGLARYAFLLVLAIGLVWSICRGFRLDVGPTIYLGSVLAFPVHVLLAWIIWAVPYSSGPSSGRARIRKAVHLVAGGVLLVVGFLPWLADPGSYWLTGATPRPHDRQAAFLFGAVAGTLTLMFLAANWFPFHWWLSSIRRANDERPVSGTTGASTGNAEHFRGGTSSPMTGRTARLALLLAALVGGYLAYKLWFPDISDVMWSVIVVLTLLGFLIDVIRYRQKLKGLHAAFILLCGCTALLIYFAADPEPLLGWLYHLGGGAAGDDDRTFLRIITAGIVIWLIWQMVQIRRKLARETFGGQPTGEAHGAQASPAKAAIHKAFRLWWAERERWMTTVTKAGLLAVYALALFAFFGGRGSGRAEAFRHTIGTPWPWFVVEKRVDGFEWAIVLSSWAWGVAAVGWLAFYAYWRIRGVETDQPVGAADSPKVHAVIWLIAAMIWITVSVAPLLFW